jgi:hypothetical protein
MTGRALFQPTSLSAITLAVTLLLGVLAPASAVAAPEGQLTWAVHVSLAPTWFDPAETGDRHAVHVPLRPARRPREADAGQPAGAEPGGVLERRARRAHLRVRPAQGRAVSQRRPADRRGRQVLVRAVSRGFVRSLQGARRGRRGGRSAAGSLSPEAAVARLPDLLRHAGHRRRLDRAQEVCREGRR